MEDGKNEGKLYLALTLTLSPEFMCNTPDILIQLNKSRKVIIKMFRDVATEPYFSINRFILYPEVTKSGNIHYHGMAMFDKFAVEIEPEIRFNYVMQNIKVIMHSYKMLGFSCIKIMHSNEWMNYIIKEFTTTQMLLNRLYLKTHKNHIPTRQIIIDVAHLELASVEKTLRLTKSLTSFNEGLDN